MDWSSLNRVFSSSADSTSFGSNNWASVYLASTPQQAAQLGIKFPGVDEVSILRLPCIWWFVLNWLLIYFPLFSINTNSRSFFFQVEEIDDVDGSTNFLISDDIANEQEIILSEEQRKRFRKVCQCCMSSIITFIIYYILEIGRYALGLKEKEL